jgi:hypothetical protein
LGAAIEDHRERDQPFGLRPLFRGRILLELRRDVIDPIHGGELLHLLRGAHGFLWVFRGVFRWVFFWMFFLRQSDDGQHHHSRDRDNQQSSKHSRPPRNQLKKESRAP